MYQLPSKLTLLTMHLQLYFPSRHLLASRTQLPSTLVHSTPRNATTMFTTKSYSLSMKHSNDGDTTLKVLVTPLMWSLITGISNTSPQPKSSCIDKHVGPITFPPSTSSSVSALENSEPSPTPLLDDGTSILKRGIGHCQSSELPTHVHF